MRGIEGGRRAAAGGLLLGIGLGGFVDGILLHQILQWHQMLSSVLPPDSVPAMQTNMLWDGLFHAGVWTATLAGVLLLWSGARHTAPLPGVGWLSGLMLLGWGAFNLVEGLIDHHLLRIHHVRGWGPDPMWDRGFLLSGVVLMAAGWWIERATGEAFRRRAREAP